MWESSLFFSCHGIPNPICLGQCEHSHQQACVVPGLPALPQHMSQQWLCHNEGQDMKVSSMITGKIISLCTTISSTLNKVHSTLLLYRRGKEELGCLLFNGLGICRHPGTEQMKAWHDGYPTGKLFTAYKYIDTKFIFGSQRSHLKLYRTSLFGWFNILILSRSGK